MSVRVVVADAARDTAEATAAALRAGGHDVVAIVGSGRDLEAAVRDSGARAAVVHTGAVSGVAAALRRLLPTRIDVLCLEGPSAPADALATDNRTARVRVDGTVEGVQRACVAGRLDALVGGPAVTRRTRSRSTPRAVRGVAVASSTGGPQALVTVLGQLPPVLDVPVVVVQHVVPGYCGSVAEWLAATTGRQVVVAGPDQRLAAGVVTLAGDGAHAEVRGHRLVRVDSPPLAGHRPSATPLLRSAARVWGAGAVAVVLTGMGRDGADAVAQVAAAGGRVLVQDPASAVVDGMPNAAIGTGAAAAVLAPEALGRRLAAMLENGEDRPAPDG